MKRSKIIMAACIIAEIFSFQVFAAGTTEKNALWHAADKIADASESVLPVEKTVVWEELEPDGGVINTSEFTIWYGETKGWVKAESSDRLISGRKLSYDFAGDENAAAIRSLINDGLYWTPFDEGAENGNLINAEVKATDVWIENTGITEKIDGSECLVFEYSIYRDSGELGYDFEQTVNDDYKKTESGIMIRTTGKVWIDGKGVPRQLESNVKYAGADYKETVKYDYDGSFMYPVQSVLEGSFQYSYGAGNTTMNFRATETMSDYWIANDFYR